jgi:NAD-dependent SIR2 family protein deacetylase
MDESRFHKMKEFLPPSIFRENMNNICDLIGIINEKKISVITGAGISQSVGLPGWSNLLNRLFGLILTSIIASPGNNEHTDDFLKLMKEAKSQHGSSYLREKLKELQSGKFKTGNKIVDISSNIDFLQLAEALYMITPSESESSLLHQDSFNSLIQHIMYSCFRDSNVIEKIVSRQKSTLYQTAQLLLKAKVENIITYNYDNLLEHMMETLISTEPKYKDITVVHQTYDNIQTDISADKRVIHVHGYMDITRECGEKSNNIVLSETQYSKIEREVYGWVNQVQTNALFSGTTLFIGFSATDYNFKRILNHCGKLFHKHYIIFNLNDYIASVFSIVKDDKVLSTDEIIDTVIDNKNDYSFETAIFIQLLSSLSLYWKHYNFYPIWCFRDDIAVLLEELTSSCP